MYARGCTEMEPSIDALNEKIRSIPRGTPVRLVVLSDGELFDTDETCAASSRYAAELREHTRINSQAIRFFTSSSQPDTRGLASVLALNNVTSPRVVDLRSGMDDESIVDSIASLFEGDGLESMCALRCDNEVMTLNPWDAKAAGNLVLRPGTNYVWFKEPPKNLRVVEDDNLATRVNVSIAKRMCADDLAGPLKPLVDSYVSRLRVLKVVNTAESVVEMNNMISYFEKLDESLMRDEVEPGKMLEDRSLAGRLDYFRALVRRRRSSLLVKMREIANDDKVAQLSAAQQADYLRTVEDKSKNNKALAKRALGSGHGLEFDDALRAEVRAMRSNLRDLDDISDEDHHTSFYSMETTLGGIRALCALDDNELDDLEATDIIQLANIVGVPCKAPIENYVDPMNYAIEKMLPGIYLSLSDVLIAHIQSNGEMLTAPGHPETTITNVVPIFDDERIFRFLRRHARTLLEYTASIGMRRVLAEIPLTYAYTITAGVWKMCEVVSDAPTEANVRTLTALAKNMHATFNGKFDYVLDLIASAKDGSVGVVEKEGVDDSPKSLYLDYHGVANLLDPIMQLVGGEKSGMLRHAKHAGLVKHMEDVLRALYCHEVYMVVRKLPKYEKADDEEAEDYVKRTLAKLLGVDSGLTETQPLFEPEPEDVKIDDGYQVDEEAVANIKQRMFFVDKIALLPSALAVASAEDNIKSARATMRPWTANLACHNFGLEFEDTGDNYQIVLDRFMLANIVQGFLFRSKKDRQDEDEKIMKIADLRSIEAQEKLLREYVRAERKSRYDTDASSKKTREREVLLKELVDRLLESNTEDDFCRLLTEGIKRGAVIQEINHAGQDGYDMLHRALLGFVDSVDISKIPLRLEKIVVLSLGRDRQDNIIFNRGNTIKSLVEKAEEIYALEKSQPEIEEFRTRYRKYGVEGLHIGVLPDLVDKYGNLPYLQCGYSSCGMRFEYRMDLWRHILLESNASLPPGHKERDFIRGMHITAKDIFREQEDKTDFDENEFVTRCSAKLATNAEHAARTEQTFRVLFGQLMRGYEERSKE